MYVRKMNTHEFHLQSFSGILPRKELSVFHNGEGYLGKIVEDKKIVSIPVHDHTLLKSETSLIEELPATVYLCPLVHEDHCLGLIELSLKDDTNEENIEKYNIFLQRVCRNIAMSIRFGQSHILVEQLLEETQHQTEEMEAQQEELRITNEELIHKTHLLESSEEELRVQQEELTQANIELNEKAKELEGRNYRTKRSPKSR